MNDETSVWQASERELVIERTLRAPPQVIFAAWTNPDLLKLWWAPRSLGASLFKCESDLRIGGAYRYEFGRDSKHPEVFSGTYIEIVAARRIVYTQIYERMRETGEALITVTFEEVQGKTRLIQRQLHPSKSVLEFFVASGMEHGLREALDQLEATTASLPAKDK